MSWFTERLSKKSSEQKRLQAAVNQAYAEYGEAYVTLNALHRQVWLQFHMRVNELYKERELTEKELGHLDLQSYSMDSFYVLVQPAYKSGSNEGSGSAERRQT